MAWKEAHGNRYRVRYRHTGRLVTDGTYDTPEAAQARVSRLDRPNQAVALRLAAPPPTLTGWPTTWLPAHLAGAGTTATAGNRSSPASGSTTCGTLTAPGWTRTASLNPSIANASATAYPGSGASTAT